MAKLSKRTQALRGKVDRAKAYPVSEALTMAKAGATAKFDETVEIHVRLGIDVKKTDQHVRGATLLPHGTGKNLARPGCRWRVARHGARQGAAAGHGCAIMMSAKRR